MSSIPEELNNEVTQLKEMHTKLLSNVISISKLEDYDDYFGGTGGLNIMSYHGAVRWLSKYEELSTLNSSEEYCKANGLPFRRQYGQR